MLNGQKLLTMPQLLNTQAQVKRKYTTGLGSETYNQNRDLTQTNPPNPVLN